MTDTIESIDLLKSYLNAFIAQKRAFGYKYIAEEESLRRFLRFTKSYGLPACGLTKDIVDAYGAARPNETAKNRANRASDLRQFAKYLNLNGIDAYVSVPVGKIVSDFTPYIFTHAEIIRIFASTDSISPHKLYNCADVYPVLFRMLYGCGLRISEALDLRLSDLDLDNGTVTIRNGKFNKTRLVAMSGSLTTLCTKLNRRIHIVSNENSFFFKNRDGSRRSKWTVSGRFRELLWESGIPYRGKGIGPRLHDLRHSFCCHALKQMSDSGIDLYCALPVLSAYVGHSSIKATEKYLRLSEEIFPDIMSRMQNMDTGIYPEVYKIETD
jgi:integrase